MTDQAPHDGFGHLSQRDFRRLARFIEDTSGIKVPPGKLTMIEGRLRRRVRATGRASLSDYCSLVFEEGGLAAETIPLLDAITTNKTDFFREPEHFRALTEQVLPALLAAGHGGAAAPLKLWSAACSIGAEPYTLAMVIDDLARRTPSAAAALARCVITATDLSTEVLETALRGIYPLAMMAPVPAEFRRRYVMRSRARDRQLVRMVPELRAMLRFARVNLTVTPYQVAADMDVIFCRNILIYFDKPTQEAVLRRLCGHLRPGGYLFLGHSESLTGFHLPLTPAGPTIFRKG